MYFTQQDVKDTFDYDPDTGICTWKVRRLKASPGEPIDERFVYRDGYIVISLKGKAQMLHRLIWVWMTGKLPEKYIDHINGIRTDNRWCNLRESTHQENMLNKSVSPKKNNPAPLGVQKISSTKWKAMITINGEKLPLGVFETAEKAHEVYLQAKILFHGHTRYTNKELGID